MLVADGEESAHCCILTAHLGPGHLVSAQLVSAELMNGTPLNQFQLLFVGLDGVPEFHL